MTHSVDMHTLRNHESKGPLNVAGIQHDPAWSTVRPWWEMFLELCVYNARVAVGAPDLAPDHTELAVLHLFLRFVNIGTFLAQVKGGFIAATNTLNLNQRGPGVAVHLTSQVAADNALGIQPSWLLSTSLLLGCHHALFYLCDLRRV